MFPVYASLQHRVFIYSRVLYKALGHSWRAFNFYADVLNLHVNNVVCVFVACVARRGWSVEEFYVDAVSHSWQRVLHVQIVAALKNVHVEVFNLLCKQNRL